MHSIIEKNKESIFQLCKENRVEKLYAFGSVLNENFNEKSDLDFIVEFKKDVQLLEFADIYFSLLFSFEDFFKRDIDLMTEKSLKNPHFIAEVNATKQLIYAT